MTTLCRFCPPEDGPNKAVTTITTADGHDLPACVTCYKEYQEQAYDNWCAEQDEERDMRDSNLDAVRELGFL